VEGGATKRNRGKRRDSCLTLCASLDAPRAFAAKDSDLVAGLLSFADDLDVVGAWLQLFILRENACSFINHGHIMSI
jgi:hypothetical protein